MPSSHARDEEAKSRTIAESGPVVVVLLPPDFAVEAVQRFIDVRGGCGAGGLLQQHQQQRVQLQLQRGQSACIYVYTTCMCAYACHSALLEWSTDFLHHTTVPSQFVHSVRPGSGLLSFSVFAASRERKSMLQRVPGPGCAILIRRVSCSAPEAYSYRGLCQAPAAAAAATAPRTARTARHSPLRRPLPAAPTGRHAMSSTSQHSEAAARPLASQACEPCKRTTPALPASEHAALLANLGPEWRIEPFPGSGELGVLQRRFEFKNFKHAMRFAQAIGDIAETNKHHPEMIVGWGHVDLAWWSHAIGGVSWRKGRARRRQFSTTVFALTSLPSPCLPGP